MNSESHAGFRRPDFDGLTIDINHNWTKGPTPSLARTPEGSDLLTGDQASHHLNGPRNEHNRLSFKKPDFFIGVNGERRFNTESSRIKDVLAHIPDRVEALLVHADVRNQELLDTSLMQELGIKDTKALAKHMVRHNVAYKDSKGNYYLTDTSMQPNEEYFEGMRFNWDTANHIDLVLASGREDALEIAKGEIRNSEYLFNYFGIVPNAATEGFTDRSQPPLHTKMISAIHNAMTEDQKNTDENKQWFTKAIGFAKEEHDKVWMNNFEDPRKDPLSQTVEGSILSRYGSKDMGYHLVAELGSGWDLTDRFSGRCGDHLPADLNSYLFDTEIYLADVFEDKGDLQEAEFYRGIASARAKEMKEKMWNEESGWFNDYDLKRKGQSEVESLAGFMPINTLDNTKEQRRMIEKLQSDFLQPYGLTLTTEASVPVLPSEKDLAPFTEAQRESILELIFKEKQWGYPNQFLNITDQVCAKLEEVALKNDDIKELADSVRVTIMQNTVIGLTEYYERTAKAPGKKGVLPEKINAVTGKLGHGAIYGDQKELGMPYAVYVKFVKKLTEHYDQKEHHAQLPKLEGTDIFTPAPLAQIAVTA